MSKKERAIAMEGLYKHRKKPDVDNLVKLYLDVLTSTAINDDNSVSLGFAVKVYSSTPKTVIYIEETDKILTMNEVYEGTWPTQ